jgi:cyclic 2,3-diphosphoglycerate synthetase
MAEQGAGWERVRDAVLEVVEDGVHVVPTVLRPTPARDIRGRSTAYFSTAPTGTHGVLAEYLEAEHGADIVHVSGNLAERGALRAELEHVTADVFLVELKAAAIDVVAEHALAHGAEVVLAANRVIPISRDWVLDETLLELAGITS